MTSRPPVRPSRYGPVIDADERVALIASRDQIDYRLHLKGKSDWSRFMRDRPAGTGRGGAGVNPIWYQGGAGRAPTSDDLDACGFGYDWDGEPTRTKQRLGAPEIPGPDFRERRARRRARRLDIDAIDQSISEKYEIPLCTEDGCDAPETTAGLCGTHYQRQRAALGLTRPSQPRRTGPPPLHHVGRRGRPRALTDEQADEIRRLHAEQHVGPEVLARLAGLSARTITAVLNRTGTYSTPLDEHSTPV